MEQKTIDEEQKTAEELLCREVLDDFTERQRRRKKLERQWELNLKFVQGNQYCRITEGGDIAPTDRLYEWEQRRVFNHIAPVIDTRLSKLSRIRPALAVRPASDEENDRQASELASAILSAVQEESDLDGVISSATMWSEICGTSFYKTVWDSAGGKKLGETESGASVNEGGVNVAAVSPFEIYPFCQDEESLEMQPSIIHAKLLPVSEIYTMYGVKLAGRELPASAPSRFEGSDRQEGFELVLERYEKPTVDLPEGRLTVTAGERLLYDGVLPYINCENGTRGYPFVKQVSVPVAGSFFGASVVERLIPVQRAYNAVKNRKHEYLNRISMGTVAVEDGSVDVDELADDGLAPGKVIVYRQGGNPPEMLTLGSVPDEFWKEENSLLTEFSKISGTGDISENADSFAGITSATGLQLIIEQDDARLNVAYQSLKRAVRSIGRQILRLYRQFATDVRLLRLAQKDGKVKVYCFKGSDISGEDVILEADTDLNLSPAQRRSVIFDLLDKGLFSDADGKTPQAAKKKLLELLGYASLADLIPAEEKGGAKKTENEEYEDKEKRN